MIIMKINFSVTSVSLFRLAVIVPLVQQFAFDLSALKSDDDDFVERIYEEVKVVKGKHSSHYM